MKGDTDEVPRGTGTYGSKSTQIGGGVAAERTTWSSAPGARRRPARGEPGRRRARPTPAASTSPARPSRRSWTELAARRCRRAPRRARGRARLPAAEPDLPVRRARRRRRGRHRDRGTSSCCASSRSTTPAGAQSARRRGPGARRRRHGHRPGALRGGRVRRGGHAVHRPSSPTPSPRRPTSGLGGVEMETPTPMNPLGAKGIGESGTIGATPAVQNAVVDALAPRRAPRGHARQRRARLAARFREAWACGRSRSPSTVPAARPTQSRGSCSRTSSATSSA